MNDDSKFCFWLKLNVGLITPKENWGIRGENADELQLNYKVNV